MYTYIYIYTHICIHTYTYIAGFEPVARKCSDQATAVT